MWYALAILALVIFGPYLARAAYDSAADWRKAGGAAWDGLRKLCSIGNNNFALGLAVGLLVGVVGVWGVGKLPSIRWPDVVPPVVTPVSSEIKVLVIEEQADRTGAISNTLNAGIVRDYLATKGKENYLRLDDESRLELMPEWVRTAAQQRGTTPTPCVVIVAGGKHYVSPLPTSPDAFLALLRKYGG